MARATRPRHADTSVWLAGPSGARKFTSAFVLERLFSNVGFCTVAIDEDELRRNFNSDLGLSREELPAPLLSFRLSRFSPKITQKRVELPMYRFPRYLRGERRICAAAEKKSLYAQAASRGIWNQQGLNQLARRRRIQF
jgi:adenylylsulfate kinase-like enzyme